MSPRTKAGLDPAHADRISRAIEARGRADEELRSAILAAAMDGASVRVLAAFTNFSTNTISRWKRAAH